VVSTLKIKKWLFLFFTTLLIGGISIILTSAVMGWDEIAGGKDTSQELFAAGIWLFIVGLLFSVISQMGFFAYLMVHRFGLGIFKSHKLWNRVQIVLILFTFFDLIYLRYVAFGAANETWLNYLMLPILLLIIALVAAYLKAKMTNGVAFYPALFFVFVVTTVEVVPAFTQNDQNWVILMLVPMVACNVWQLLVLHHLTSPSNEKSA
jgi:KinB signaling pathway activation protein